MLIAQKIECLVGKAPSKNACYDTRGKIVGRMESKAMPSAFLIKKSHYITFRKALKNNYMPNDL
jgi:hypothetical protein